LKLAPGLAAGMAVGADIAQAVRVHRGLSVL
jgi:hypothetical protein